MDVFMQTTSIVGAFLGLPHQAKIEALVHLIQELTILVRDTYEVGSSGLSNPARLRALNEVQHRISSHALALLRNDPCRYPDEVLANIILGHDDDLEFQRQITEAFARVMAR
jgi:hypothetical protein